MSKTRLLWFPAMCGWLACLVLWMAGCGQSEDGPITAETSKYEVADGDSSSPTGNTAGTPTNPAAAGDPVGKAGGPSNPGNVPRQPPSIPGQALSDFSVPQGTPEELVQFIGRVDAGLSLMQQQQIDPSQQQEFFARVENMLRAKAEAADRILAAEAKPADRMTAVNAKLDALRTMAALQLPDVVDQFRSFCKGLLADKDPQIARRARVELFRLTIDEVAMRQNTDLDGLLKELDSLLQTEDRDRLIMDAAQQAYIALSTANHTEQARQALTMTVAAFKDHQDPDIASEAHNMQHYISLMELEYDQKLAAVVRNEENAIGSFMEAAGAVLEFERPDQLILGRTAQAIETLERTGQLEACQTLIDKLTATYADNEQLSTVVEQATDLSRRHLKLVGQPLEVEGVGLDGQAFDWSQYRGKIVLVDFWATWCRPCLDEFPNMKDNLEQYQDQGFTIVGVNMDDNPQDAKAFLDKNPLPWTTVLPADPSNQLMAERCSVDSIPFMLLVDRDGVVIDLHVRGPRLDQRLAELLGPATSPAGTGQRTIQPDGAPETDDGQRFFVSLTDDPPAADEQQLELPAVDPDANPYLAPAGYAPAELVDFILSMEEKPKSLQDRPGFAEAIVEACDRLNAADTKDSFKLLATMAKFRALHRRASFGNEAADQQLKAWTEACRDDPRMPVAEVVHFMQLERRSLESDQLNAEQIVELLGELKTFFTDRELEEQHLRIASTTVRTINQLDDGATREKYFSEFGNLFAASRNKELAQYGKKLAKGPEVAASDLIGKPLELSGLTALGTPLDWNSYRGQVVLVDFWATWCGPCRREAPHVKALYDRFHDQGFEVVAVSLDKDLDALTKYLEENQIPWVNLVGEETQQLASRFGVRGIPTMMLVDAAGNVVAISHRVAELTPKVEELMAAK